MKKVLITMLAALLGCCVAYAQEMPDTTGLYADRTDSLSAAVAVGTVAGNYMPKFKDDRIEVISAAGLCKMACCNLAESFENSASVSVGYADAVTGARQIRLLGQNGVYTQMLDENRPVMRGLSSPWGLTYVPSQWLESIQVAKGVTSVINGVESMTGQINLEHRKTTDEKPLYVQGSFMNDTKADLNVVSALQLDEWQKWSTVIFGHVDGNFATMDHNGDGFMDDPKSLQVSLGNRWLYYDYDSGAQLKFGFSAIHDNRYGGQTATSGWHSNILNNSLDAFVKFGIPVDDDQDESIAVIADVNAAGMDAKFGSSKYYATQMSAFVNFLYQNNLDENHKFTVGASETFDRYLEDLTYFKIDNGVPGTAGLQKETALNTLGAFGEYTLHLEEKFSLIAGLRADWFRGDGVKLSPRLTVRWSPVDWLVIRGNGGRGLRYSSPVIDNIGIMSTGKYLFGEPLSHTLEDSWTFGANATFYLPFGATDRTSISFDYFRTDFSEKVLLQKYAYTATFARLSDIGGRSFTDNWQVDFSVEPVERFTVTLTGRYTNARETEIETLQLAEKPMTSRYKAVLNLQYSTRLSKWIFDFTASLNGPCRVWDYMKSYGYTSGVTESYPLLYVQVTRRFKGIDVYVGGENLTNYRQQNPILCADAPRTGFFDASCVWGPISGIKVYAGLRLTIWKTN